MKHVKTAISIRQSLYQQTEDLAKQMHIPRSQLIAKAIEEFIQQHHNQRLLAQLNQAYPTEPEPNEREHLLRMKRKHRQRMEAEGKW